MALADRTHFRSYLAACTLALGLFPLTAGGAVLLVENFDYTDGDLTGSGIWTQSNLGAPPLQVSAGQALVVHGSRYSNLTAAPLRYAVGSNNEEDVAYYAVDLTVPANDSYSYQGALGDYCAALVSDDNSHIVGRLYICRGLDEVESFTFVLGAEHANAIAPSAWWPQSFAFGTRHKVIVAFDRSDGSCTMWVDPSSESSPFVRSLGTSHGLVIHRFALAQNHTTESVQAIDGIRVGTTFNDVFSDIVAVETSSWGAVKAGFR